MTKKIILAMAMFPLVALADSVTDIGDTTLKVLEQQRTGVGAVENRPMLKDVATRTYDRYLESFTHPIPDQFEREDSFVTGQ